MYFDPEVVVPNPALSLREGAIVPWEVRGGGGYYFQLIEALADHYQFDINQPFEKLPEKVQKIILFGSGKEEVRFYFDQGSRRQFYYVITSYSIHYTKLYERYWWWVA